MRRKKKDFEEMDIVYLSSVTKDLNLKDKKVLGEGRYGKVREFDEKWFVYLYTKLRYQKSVIKKVKKVTGYMNEPVNMTLCSPCHGVIPLLKCYSSKKSFCMIFPKGECLTDYRKDSVWDLKDVFTVSMRLLYSLLKTLNDIHGIGVIHRDVTNNNIIVIDGNFSLIDFGLSKLVKGCKNEKCKRNYKTVYIFVRFYRLRYLHIHP